MQRFFSLLWPMPKKVYLSLAGSLLLLISLFWYVKSNRTHAYGLPDEDAFSTYISAYTVGVISSESRIQVRLASDIATDEMVGKENSDNVFEFSPAVSGNTYWVDHRTLAFQPDKRLKAGSVYNVKFKLAKVMDVRPEAEVFSFDVKTMDQNFEVEIEGMRPVDRKDLKKQKFTGILQTADVANTEEVELVLTAMQNNKKLPVSWVHNEDRRTHAFTIENVARTEKAGEVKLSWDGKPLGISKAGSEKLEVPSLSDFKLMSAKVMQNTEQYVALYFSDPLQEKQQLEGLVSIEGNHDLRFLIDENALLVYPAVRQTGSRKMDISAGIKNIMGYKMKNGTQVTLQFEQINPAVRLVKSGTILPSTDGLVLPFEAVNLKAVDVRIVKIFEDNVAQFLQVNQLDGKQELKRVGRPLLQKTISLNASGITDLGRWNRFTLDLGEYIKTEPGAIYQVTIGFRKKHSLFFCAGDDKDEEELSETEDAKKENWDEGDNYYYYEEEYYYDDEGYDYSQRNNPCHASYYTSSRSITTNILASDLGMIAKRGDNGKMLVVVTDIRSTEPLSGVSLKLQNFQQKVIQTAITNSEGMAEIQLDNKPYLLIAQQGNQKGYLRVDDGSALSLSNFDVSGEKIEKGIKGFIYAERDVWRPGDSLYLNFILQDMERVLPENYPVVMELSNPQGQLIKKLVKSTPVNDFYAFHTATSPEAPTGNWTARVKAGGATFSKTIKIETIKPNRLKIKVDLAGGSIKAGQANPATLQVNWLHGATAKNLKAEMEMIVIPSKTEFNSYLNYNFDDPTSKIESESVEVFNGRINENGEASFQIKAGKYAEAPGKLRAVLKTKVFEEGGDFSVDRSILPFDPFTSYVGIKVDKSRNRPEEYVTGTAHLVELVTVDTAGKPVSRSNVEVELIKLDWRWWWDQNENAEANYMGRAYQTPVSQGKVTTVNGKGSWSFKVDYPEWGRYYIKAKDPVSGHTTGKIVYIDWPGSIDRSSRQNPDGAMMLTLSASKEKYEVKEEAKITFPSPAEGRALVSIENGSRVIRTFWTDIKKGETTVQFEVTEEMAPNAYVHVTMLQPHRQTTNDLPVRLYGVVPFMVDNPATYLAPEIAMADKLTPEKPFTVKVSEKNGHKMTYTLAVVDEGLLDLTKFKTPEPWKAFYKREALGVKTWDMYQHVIGAFGGSMDRLLAIGGDEEGRKMESSKINRFKPVVKFIGPFELKSNSTASHVLTLDPYVGSVRVMVVAGYEGAYGQAEKTVPVTQPLMVLGTLPRVLGPDESVVLPVNVFAMEPAVREVEVEVSNNELLSLESARTQGLSFSKPDDKTVYFNLKVKPRAGDGKVSISASSGSSKASYTIDIPVRNPNPAVTNVYQTLLQPGQAWNTSFNAPGMLGTNKAVLEISSMPSLNLGKRLEYLLQYPYGCVEQTISTVFPQLYVSATTELDALAKAKIEKNVKQGIERLKSFQLISGGFSYWPGNTEADDWGTNYAGHFLTEAAERGYAVPEDMLRKWKKYQRSKALNWQFKNNNDLDQAYRLYTLALAKAPETGAMNRFREQKGISTAAQWRLAAAYALAGQKEVATSMVAKLNFDVSKYNTPGDTYGSELRDQAMILETLVLLGQETKALDLILKISNALSEDTWMSTQTTAYCLIAGGKMYEKSGKDVSLDFRYTLNGESVNAGTGLPVVKKDIKVLDKNTNQLSITNNGKGKLYARVFVTGIPVAGEETNLENNLSLSVVYRSLDGKVIDPTEMEQGKDFMAEVTVANPGTRGNYGNLALAQVFPSGWEIHNTRMEVETGAEKASFDYQDIRDDRVYTFFSLKAREKKTFKVLLNATYAGRFYLPAISCEAMYDNSIHARKAGQWVTVGKRTAVQ